MKVLRAQHKPAYIATSPGASLLAGATLHAPADLPGGRGYSTGAKLPGGDCASEGNRRRRMWNFKNFNRLCKTWVYEWLSDRLLSSGHFRRTFLRRLFINHSAPGALVYVAFSDHVLVVDPRDHMISFSLMSGKSWQRLEQERAISIAETAGAFKPGGWFVDVGANIGTQTIYAVLSGKFQGVVAIEPEPHNLELLRRNLALNGMSDRVHVVAEAASSTHGTAQLRRDLQNFGGHSIEPGQELRRSDTITVPTRPLDDILAGLGIAPEQVSLLTIDVEGHEAAVLEGMPLLRAQGAPLVVEVNGAIDDGLSARRLATLLAPTHHLVAPLGSAIVSSATDDGRPLTSFDFGLRQTDVLIYNRGPSAGA